ncbi:MAG TPA: hypothetical protein VLA16_02540 [Ideonella sp.]|nr:hypothetical protein [Ideonella sp.]
MTQTESATAAYVAFEEFRDGLPLGRFRVIVNPALAQRFVAQRVNATPIAIALIGPGIACAVGGYVVLGAVLVAAGILLRRAVKWQAPKILLHLATRHPATYYDATTTGVMEVRPV